MAYPELNITFLGTGTSGGVPMIGCGCEVCTSANKKDNRLRSSILVKSKNTTIAVDAGPDFRYQMLRANVRHLDAVVFTHPHKDHVAGLDDVRAYNYWSRKPMQIYANEMTQAVLVREFPYAFSDI
ncbi:MAG TPA: MBL fold metallo-hydrolase, partial [Flavitalea sp.]|nr:MBL fold metallo-hydrolase [Flavitalea sp.]